MAPMTLRPRLVVDGAARAIEYYVSVLGAREIERYEAAAAASATRSGTRG